MRYFGVTEYLYDVALSFAGEERTYVRRVAERLLDWGVRLFFDENFVADMWGEDLNEYLQSTYGRQAGAVVMFVSAAYEAKAFPTAERRASFAAAMHRDVKVWPVRFDDTDLPGLNENISYMSAQDHVPEALADLVASKLITRGIALSRPRPASVVAVPRPATTAPLSVVVRDPEGNPLDDASVSVVSNNGTMVKATTTGDGRYTCAVPAGRLVRIWVAHLAHPGLVEEELEANEDHEITLGSAAGAASTIMGSTGHLPSVQGRFNPILDSNGRTYVYVENAAIDGRAASPAKFTPGIPFEVEDADGSVTVVTILDIRGHGALVEYRSPS
jgi:hypothetical protein